MEAKRGRQGAAEDRSAPDALFRAWPSEFISLRNSLAKEAAQKGDKAQAEFLRKLPKPSLAVWAINQLSRDKPEAIRALLESADRVKREQAKALRGSGGSAEELRAASAELRRLLGELVKAAADVLTQAGHERSSTLLRRVETTLNSIAIGADAERGALTSGQLTREVEQFGFPIIASAGSSAAPKQIAPEPRAQPARAVGGGREVRKQEKDAAREGRAAARRQEVSAAAKALDQARRSARSLSASARKASTQAGRRATRAQDAERLAAARREEATAAEHRAAELKRQAQEAEQKLADAERKLIELKAATRSDV